MSVPTYYFIYYWKYWDAAPVSYGDERGEALSDIALSETKISFDVEWKSWEMIGHFTVHHWRDLRLNFTHFWLRVLKISLPERKCLKNASRNVYWECRKGAKNLTKERNAWRRNGGDGDHNRAFLSTSQLCNNYSLRVVCGVSALWRLCGAQFYINTFQI